MARTQLSFSVETDGMLDAIADLERVSEALPRRHGAAFRDLDRRLCAIFEGDIAITPPDVRYLGDGIFVAVLPIELSALLATARRIGVI